MKNFILFLVLAFGISLQAQTYSLPNLKYQYTDYEPDIDALTMQIHHSKHHKAYIDNLNKAIAGTKMETTSLIDLMLYASFRSEAIRNNAGGHYNHTLFWEILAPKDKQSGIIHSEFDLAVKTQFGSMDSLKKLINQAGTTRFGSGWAWLIVTPDKKLMVTSTGNQDNPIMDVAKDRGIPILGIDVWEHAYYLKYQNKRADYLAGIWNLVDWGIVSDKYKSALSDSLLINIEKDSWPALKDFHKVMSQTFHPSETGDFKPLRTRSNEFLAKALLLKNSIPPVSLNKPAIQVAMDKLVKESTEIQKAVQKNAKDETLKKLIVQAHDTFHVIQGLCKE
jgi:superoxide dismutase